MHFAGCNQNTRVHLIVKGDNEKDRGREKGRVCVCVCVCVCGGGGGGGVGGGGVSAIGIVPGGHKPRHPFVNSLWLPPPLSSSPFSLSQSLLLLFLWRNSTSHFAGTLSRKYEQIWHFLFVPLLTTSSVPLHQRLCLSAPPPPILAISKVNTPLNAGLTHFHCGWFCFQFSHHLGHPTTSEEKRKLVSRNQNKKKTKQNKTNVANQPCKRQGHFPPPSELLSFKGTKACAKVPRKGNVGQNRARFSHFFCGSETVIAVFLPFFLSGRAWERPQSAA